MLAVMGEHGHGLAGRVRHGLRPHSHEAADKVDAALEASAEGMRALWISLAVLAATPVLRVRPVRSRRTRWPSTRSTACGMRCRD